MTKEPTTTPPDESKSSHDFVQLVIWASALSVAITAALLASLKEINPSVHFKFSLVTVLAFFGSGLFTVAFFRLVLRSNPRRRMILCSVAGIVAVLGYFAYGLKNVTSENRISVAIGAATAIAVLSFFGWIIWRLIRFLEADDKRNR